MAGNDNAVCPSRSGFPGMLVIVRALRELRPERPPDSQQPARPAHYGVLVTTCAFGLALTLPIQLALQNVKKDTTTGAWREGTANTVRAMGSESQCQLLFPHLVKVHKGYFI